MALTILNIWSKFSAPDKQAMDTLIIDTHPEILLGDFNERGRIWHQPAQQPWPTALEDRSMIDPLYNAG